MTPRRHRWPFTDRAARRGLARNRDGSVAVEFAMVLFPFLAMLFAIIEVALILTIDSVLENAVVDTGRLVRTGQASAMGMTGEQFKEQLCSRMSVFSGDCDARASIDVRVVTSFETPPDVDPVGSGVFDPTVPLAYSNGAPDNWMLVRVWYRHPLMTSFLSQALSRTADGEAVLSATTAFKNEPPGGGQPVSTPPAATS
ncbi:MAG: TadE/TadG family type IV pilus assembly protein [Pseudomonadota bacterium]|nr:TadE/TadG family type IV pilus assembly protein [Pseudomonadota bacterium]